MPPIGPPCITTFEGVDPGASVPHYLPEKNPFVDELTKKYGVPRDAVIGMPETLYPEYRKKLRATPAVSAAYLCRRSVSQNEPRPSGKSRRTSSCDGSSGNDVAVTLSPSMVQVPPGSPG